MIWITLIDIMGQRFDVNVRVTLEGHPPLAVKTADGRLFLQRPNQFRDSFEYEEVPTVEVTDWGWR